MTASTIFVLILGVAYCFVKSSVCISEIFLVEKGWEHVAHFRIDKS
jgi:hypothetical protein